MTPLSERLDRYIAPVKNVVLTIAAATLAIMMFMTALDVALRYIFSSPIPGGLELMEYMMAVLVPFAVTITAYQRAHVGVDLVMERFPLKVRSIVAAVTTAMMLVFYALITWQCAIHTVEQYHSGMTSAVLLIPIYPFVASLTVAFGLLTLVTLIECIENLTEVQN